MKGKQEMVDLSGDPNKEKLRKVTNYGDFGIHREGPGTWTISHMPTKARVANFQSQEQAKRAVYRLKTETTGWNFSDPEKMPKELSQTVPPILKQVLNEFAPETLPERGPRAPEAPKKVKAGPEKMNKATGLTPSQEKFVTDKLQGYELPAGKEEKALKIKVPGDGEFTVRNELQANNLYRKITGEDLPNVNPNILAGKAESGKLASKATIHHPKTTAEPTKYNEKASAYGKSSTQAALRIYGTPEKAIEKLNEQLRVQGEDMEADQRRLTTQTIKKLEVKQQAINAVTDAIRELKPNGGVVSIKDLRERLGGGAADKLAEAIDNGAIDTTRGDTKINKPDELFRDIVGVQLKGGAAKEAAEVADISKKPLAERIAMARQAYDPPEIEKTTKPWGTEDWDQSKRNAYKQQFREKYGLTEKQLDEIDLRKESGLSPEAKRAFGMKAQPSKEYQASEKHMPGQTEKPNVNTDETIIREMVAAKDSARSGGLVSISDLRAASSLKGEAFDKAVLDLAEKGVIALHRHDAPLHLSEEQRNAMVREKVSGKGTQETGYDYYIGAAFRNPDAPEIKAALAGKPSEKPMIPLGSPTTTESGGLKAGDKVQWKEGGMTLKGEVKGFDKKGNALVHDIDGGETVTVKPERLKPRGDQETLASRPSWRDVKRLEGAPKTFEEAQQLVRDVRSEYRQRSGEREGTLYLNHQGIAVFASAGKQAGVKNVSGGIEGVNMQLGSLQKIADKLRERAGNYDNGQTLNTLADQIETAIADANAQGYKAIPVVNAAAESVIRKKTIREEDYHGWQRRAGLLKDERGGQVAEHFKDNPTYQHIRKQLIDHGYPEDEIVLNVEAAAKLASGQHEDYGVSVNDANDYLHSYYNHLAQTYGPEILEGNIRVAPSAKRSLEDVREIRGVQRPARSSPMATGTATAGRPGGRQVGSTNAPAMASGIQSRGTAGSETPNGPPGAKERTPAQRTEGTQQVKSRSSGTILGSGFGSLQGLFEKGKQQSPSKPLPNVGKFNIGAIERSAAKVEAKRAGSQPKTAREYFDNVIARDLAPTKQKGVNQPLIREAQEALKTAAIKTDKGKMSQPQTEAIIQASDDLMTAARMGDHKAIIDARKALRKAQIGQEYQTSALGKAGAIAKEAGGTLKALGQSSRSAVFGADLSFPLRQAWALTVNPLNWGNAARAGKNAMYQALKSKEGAKRVQETLRNHESFGLAQERGLELSTFGKGEEVYQGIENVEKLPLVGKIYERTEAANTAFLDYLRLQKFHSEVQTLEKKGITGNQRVRAERAIAEAVNTMTGKTDLGSGKFKGMTDALQGTVMTSPQLNVSRLQQLNPVKYAQLYKESPQAAKLMARETGLSAATIIGLGMLGTVAGVGKFVTDRKDPDFGKFRAGKVTHDLSGGLLPQIKLALEIGDYVGAEGKNLFAHSKKTEKAIGTEREEMLSRAGSYIRTRETPLAGLAHDIAIKGKDIEGNKMTVRDLLTKSGAARASWRAFGPAYIGDFYDGFKQGTGTGFQTLPTFFGGQETVITPQMEKKRREAKKKAQSRK